MVEGQSQRGSEGRFEGSMLQWTWSYIEGKRPTNGAAFLAPSSSTLCEKVGFSSRRDRTSWGNKWGNMPHRFQPIPAGLDPLKTA